MTKFTKFAVAAAFAFGFVSIASAATVTVPPNLMQGSMGQEVMDMQSILGITADGNFGPMTKASVMAFQSANGLTADGVVGAMTAAKLNAVGTTTTGGTFPAGCTSAVGFSPTTGMSCAATTTTMPAGCVAGAMYSSTTGEACDGETNDDNGSTSGGTLSGDGETSITDISYDDADDTDIDEGAESVSVGQIQFDVDDADAQLDRVDVVFQSTDNQVGINAGEEDRPWRVFDNVYLMNEDGDEIASMSADDEDMWDDADQIGGMVDADAYRIRFTDVGEIFNEGANNATVWVAVDVSSSVDGADTDDAQWTTAIEDSGLRFTDGAGINTEEDAGSDTSSFSIQQAGGDSEFKISKSSDTPDSKTLEVKNSTTSTETIATFTLKADEDGGDIKLNDFPIDITVGNPTGALASYAFNAVVDDVTVVIDGNEYDADLNPVATAIGDGLTVTQTFTFGDMDDDDIVINSGDEMDLDVKVKFKSQNSAANYDNDTTIVAATNIGSSDIEDADSGDDIGSIGGDVTAETMKLASSGISVEPNDTSATVTAVDLADNDLGVYKVIVDITAFQDDAFISQAGATAFTSQLQNAGTHTTAGLVAPTATTPTISSTADTDGTSYRIDEGSTETFTFTITVNPNPADEGKSLEEQLLTIVWGTTNTGIGQTYTISTANLSDYRTDGVVIPD